MSCARGCCPSPAHHFRSVAVSRGRARSVDATERRWDADMPAYARLRKEGLSLPQIDGSARLEALANERCEIEMGRVIRDREERSVTAELYAEVS